MSRSWHRQTLNNTHALTMQSVIAMAVFGVEPWPTISTLLTKVHSTAMLKVKIKKMTVHLAIASFKIT